MKRNYRRRVDGGVRDQGNRMTSATEQSNLLQTSDFINKVDRNNARNEKNRRNNNDDDENLASNPWTRQAASERKKRKAQRMANVNALKGDGGAATSKSIDVEYNNNNNNNRSSKVANMKKELKQMNQLANTFSVGSAPYRNEIDSGAFDASVSYRIDLSKVCGTY